MKTQLHLKSLMVISFLLVTNILFAQSSTLLIDGINKLNRVFLSNDISEVMNTHGIFERIIETGPDNHFALYYKLLAEYRLITADRNSEFKMLDKYYDTAIESLEKLGKYKMLASEAKTLKAAIHMMKLADSPMSGIFLSPKIHSLLDAALVDNPGNPRAYLVRGIMAFNTPAMFGGSLEDAIKHFQNSQKLFESASEENELMPSWGYLETFAWLGRAYMALEDYDAAKSAFEKGLEVEPNFGWIKYALLPQLNQHLSKKND